MTLMYVMVLTDNTIQIYIILTNTIALDMHDVLNMNHNSSMHYAQNTYNTLGRHEIVLVEQNGSNTYITLIHIVFLTAVIVIKVNKAFLYA